VANNQSLHIIDASVTMQAVPARSGLELLVGSGYCHKMPTHSTSCLQFTRQ